MLRMNFTKQIENSLKLFSFFPFHFLGLITSHNLSETYTTSFSLKSKPISLIIPPNTTFRNDVCFVLKKIYILLSHLKQNNSKC